MGVLYYKECYTLMANAPEDLSALKKAYPELRYDATGLLASGILDKELLAKLRDNLVALQRTIDCVLDGIIVEEGDSTDTLLELYIQNGGKGLIVEHQTYKQFGKSKEKTYRIDKGDGTPGNVTHIHVFNKHGQMYAMRVDGKAHDGSKVQLSKHDQKALKDLGFQVPVDGIVEWLTPEIGGRQLLLD